MAIVALFADMSAECDTAHAPWATARPFIGSAGSFLGYLDFADERLPRRLRSKLYRLVAEEAARVVRARTRLEAAGFHLDTWYRPNPWRTDLIEQALDELNQR